MSCVKREKDRNTVLACKSILLDIEGTTTSISFVKDVLFPYVRVNLQDYINKRWDSDSLQEIVTALRSQAKEDGLNNIDGVVTIPEDGTKEELIEAVIKNVFWLMDNDKKTKSLKDLQGLIMEEGYVKGDIKGHVYDDVGECLKSWRVQDKSVYIYSSGSVHAQKLLFGHSIQGDLLQFISGHFDTSVGPKGESTSYKRILEEISCSPNEVAFFTDVPREARAAKEAGLSAILLSREGNTPLTDEDKATYPVISSFEVIEFESTSKKLKLCTDTDVNIEDNKSINICLVSDNIQTNSDNPKSDGDVQISDEADSQSMTDKNNGTVTEQLCQDSKLSPVKLDSSSMEICNGDEQMLGVPSFTENKKDDLREDNKVQISHHETKGSAKSDDPAIKEIHEQKSSPPEINNCEADDNHEKNHDIVNQEASGSSEHKDEALKSLVNENEKSVTDLEKADISININGSTTETSEKGAVPEMSSVNHEKMLVNLDTKELKSDLTSQSQANSDHLKCENDLSTSNVSSKFEESQTKLDDSMEVSESVESEQKLEIKVEETNSHSVSESMPVKCSIKLPESNEMLKSHLETDKKVSECIEISGDLNKEIEMEKSNGMPKIDDITSNQKDTSNPELESAEEKQKLQESPSKLKTEVITSDKTALNSPNDITKIDSEQVITTPEETKETITDIISHEGKEKTSPTPNNETGTCFSDNGMTPTTTVKQLTSKQGIETDLSKSAKPNDIEVCQDKDDTNCTSNDTEVNGLFGRKVSEDTGNLSKDLLDEKQHSDLTHSDQSNGAKVQHDQCDTNGTHGTEVSGPLEGQKTEDTSSFSKPILSEKQCSDSTQCCKSNDVELQQDHHDNGTSNGTEVNDPLERQMTKDDSNMSKDCLTEKQHSDLSKNGKCNEVEVHKCDTNGTSDDIKVKDPLGEKKSEDGSHSNDVNGLQDGKKSCSLECSDSEAIVEA